MCTATLNTTVSSDLIVRKQDCGFYSEENVSKSKQTAISHTHCTIIVEQYGCSRSITQSSSRWWSRLLSCSLFRPQLVVGLSGRSAWARRHSWFNKVHHHRSWRLKPWQKKVKVMNLLASIKTRMSCWDKSVQITCPVWLLLMGNTLQPWWWESESMCMSWTCS